MRSWDNLLRFASSSSSSSSSSNTTQTKGRRYGDPSPSLSTTGDKDDDDDSCSESDRSDDEGDTTEVVKALVSPRRSARTSSARTRSKSSNTAIDRDIRRRSRKSPHYGGSDAVSSTDRKWFFDRAARVEYFIEVALVLRQLGNFYGLFEVMLALTDPYVSRLRHTWVCLSLPFSFGAFQSLITVSRFE